MQNFGARYYDAKIGRWWSVDPLAAKYPSISPYVFCANNPIIYVDPNGMEIVDSNGDRITYEIQEDGTISWSSNAPNDVIRVGNAMAKTAIGREVLRSMDEANHPITITINTKDIPKTSDGKTIYGYTTTKVNHDEVKNQKVIIKSDIVIYEASWQDLYRKKEYDGKNRGFIMDGETIAVTKYCIDDNIGATATHEGIHVTDYNSMASYSTDKVKKT